jgi:hypothetical protein
MKKSIRNCFKKNFYAHFLEGKCWKFQPDRLAFLHSPHLFPWQGFLIHSAFDLRFLALVVYVYLILFCTLHHLKHSLQHDNTSPPTILLASSPVCLGDLQWLSRADAQGVLVRVPDHQSLAVDCSSALSHTTKCQVPPTTALYHKTQTSNPRHQNLSHAVHCTHTGKYCISFDPYDKHHTLYHHMRYNPRKVPRAMHFGAVITFVTLVNGRVSLFIGMY